MSIYFWTIHFWNVCKKKTTPSKNSECINQSCKWWSTFQTSTSCNVWWRYCMLLLSAISSMLYCILFYVLCLYLADGLAEFRLLSFLEVRKRCLMVGKSAFEVLFFIKTNVYLLILIVRSCGSSLVNNAVFKHWLVVHGTVVLFFCSSIDNIAWLV